MKLSIAIAATIIPSVAFAHPGHGETGVHHMFDAAQLCVAVGTGALVAVAALAWRRVRRT